MKCEKNQATAKPSSWRPPGIMPLQKFLKQNCFDRAEEKRVRGRTTTTKIKKIPSLTPHPTIVTTKEAPIGAKISCGALHNSAARGWLFLKWPAYWVLKAQVWFCLRPSSAALGNFLKHGRGGWLLPPPTSNLQQVLPQFAQKPWSFFGPFTIVRPKSQLLREVILYRQHD